MKTIGVDLGTTNSCVYYLDEAGKPVLVTDARGNGIFPSAVWSAGAGKEHVVGHKAKARVGTHPPPIIAVKRKMGTEQKVRLGDDLVTPVDVSADILRYTRNLVESVTNDKVGAVVVTVPAYFDVAPRRDTQTAAVHAFFDGDENEARGRLELLLEPEAAACAYLVDDPAQELLVLVYDLGGGTFDVTVLKKSPEEGLTAIAFGGDPHLGGDNVDDRFASWIAYRIRGGKQEALTRILTSGHYEAEERYTVFQQVLTNDVAGLRGALKNEDRDLLIPNPPRFLLDLDASRPEDLVRIQKLKWLGETAKIQLTNQSEVAIIQQGIFQDQAGEIVDVDMDITQENFNLLIGDMIDATVRATLAVVEKSGRRPSDFDRIVLVGGSSRMPVVAQELKKVFTAPVLLQNAMADKIVAQGAAIRAGSMRMKQSEGGITLEYPQQTADSQASIAGRLDDAAAGVRAFLTPLTGDSGAELEEPVEGGRFLFRAVTLQGTGMSRFKVEVEDRQGVVIAQNEVRILRIAGDERRDAPTSMITKPIRYLTRKGLKELFPEGEPLPATKVEICRRGGREDFVSIPIYEGDRELCELRINGVDRSLAVGAEIKLSVTIERDYSVRSSAEIVSTRQQASVEFNIEPIKIPSLKELDGDKEHVLEEIENAMPMVKDPNAAAGFRRTLRKLENSYAKARSATEPNCHQLYTIVGEMRKLRTEVVGAQEFMKPPKGDFEGAVRSCRYLAGKLKENAAVSKDDVLKKIDILEKAGKDAWDQENQREWEMVNKEIHELRYSLERAVEEGGGKGPSAAALQQALLGWLDELAETVEKRGLQDDYMPRIEDLKSKTRAIDIRDEDTAKEKLVELAQDRVKKLELDIRDAGTGRVD